MSVVLGLDLGTTTTTALALAADSGDILARVTIPSGIEVASLEDRARGRSLWDPESLTSSAHSALRQAADQMGASWSRLAGLALTGQQHGGLLVDDANRPLTPLIGWQDRRGDDPYSGTDRSYLAEALARLGTEAPQRTGCRLAHGFLATTLFWWKCQDLLPKNALACFLSDHIAALLTGTLPVTDPTLAASAGVYDVQTGKWMSDQIAALELPPTLFSEVRPSSSLVGTLTSAAAEATGLPEGLPVYLGAGDNQASFLGSVSDHEDSELINIGTGGQVSVTSAEFVYDPRLETRPFPGGGFLLACVGLCGGRTYALLERFFRNVGRDLFGYDGKEPLYEQLNRLAESVPPGTEGLICNPLFTGARHDPTLRGAFTGISAENFTPGHLARALIEGMARTLRGGHEIVESLVGKTRNILVGAGNGVRENRLLAGQLAEEFGRPLHVPRHREEAAFGAALLAAVGAGIFPDIPSTGSLIRHL